MSDFIRYKDTLLRRDLISCAYRNGQGIDVFLDGRVIEVEGDIDEFGVVLMGDQDEELKMLRIEVERYKMLAERLSRTTDVLKEELAKYKAKEAESGLSIVEDKGGWLGFGKS